MDPLLASSLVAAVPATIAAIAALYSSLKNQRQLTPSNGHTVAQMVEELWDELTDAKVDIDSAEDDRASMRKELREHDERLQGLSHDVQSHWRTGVCPQCKAIIQLDQDDVDGTPV